MTKKKDKRRLLLLLFLIILGILVIIYFGVNKTTYAFQNNSNIGNYVLNPDWLEYTSLSEEKQKTYEVVPEKYIYQYKKEKSSKIKLFKASENYPEYYNLNDEGYSTPPDYQGSLGICWAFAAASTMETYLLKNGISNINNPIKFSTRQLDYASVHKDYITEGFNPYYMVGRNYPGSGARFNTAFILMSSGISPVTTDKFGDSITDTSKKSINETINLDNVEYVVDSYVNYGAIGDYTSSEERNSWIKEIKNHLLNYGSVAISVKGSSVYSAGSCIHLNEDKSNFLVNQNGNCNETDKSGHAMAIIGYDDNYTYKYCRLSSTTSNDLTSCDNIVSGKGAFILKNSWGENYSYPYLAYTSNVDGAYGITGVSKKDWDTNYDTTKENDSNFEYKLSTVTYYKSNNIKELLKKISFYSNTTEDMNYEIYLSANGKEEYTKIGTVTTNKVGLNSFYIEKDIILDGDKFSIKIVSENGYVDRIYAFTKNLNSTNDIKIDTVIKNQKEYEMNDSELFIYSITENVSNGDKITYQLLDTKGNDISNLLTVDKNYNLNNQVKPTIKINNVLPPGNLILKTIYNNKEVDSDILKVNSLKNLWSGGSGTIDDPYLISNIEDLKKIYTSEEYLKLNYKLINDLDFSNINDWNAGTISNYQAFSGTLDGDNHIISGLSASSNIPTLFYSLNKAYIKNMIFSDIKINFSEESGWGNLISIMSYDSTLENIIITRTVTVTGNVSYAGGLIGTAYNSKFIHIANYANINTNYQYEGKASGIVNEGYGIEINECYNYGTIIANKSIAAGLVGILKPGSDQDSVIKNSYNYGYIESSIKGGGIVGQGESSVIENTYNIFPKEVKNNIGNIIGTSSHMGIKNSFYLEQYGSLLVEDEEDSTTKINVMGKNNDELKIKDTYLNFDFNNIWKLDNDEYPYLKNFNYCYLNEIEVESKMQLEVGESKKIDINFIPENASNKKLKYEVLNNEIIKIDQEGNVTALKKGNTTIKIYALDGSNIIKEIAVTITSDEINLDDYEILENNYLKIEANSSADDVKNNIYQGNKYKIEISSKNSFLGTGDKISIFDNNILKQEYTIVILGDITGNGIIDVGDVAKLYRYIKGTIDMEKEYKLAADVHHDSKLEINDIAKLYRYIKRKIGNLEN